jgi:hypothetical protein
MVTEFWWEDQMETDYLEDLCINGIILNCFFGGLNLSASD